VKAPQGDRGAGKRLCASGRAARAPGRQPEHRAMIEQAVEELAPVVGTRPACRALGASHAKIYRRRPPPGAAAPRPRPAPRRALSDVERDAVLAELRSERFVDCSPAQVWATLLDEGRYLASDARCTGCWPPTRRCASGAISSLTRPTSGPSCSPSDRTSSGVGHLQAQRPGEVDVLLPLRDPRRLQPLLRGLDRPAPRVGERSRAADRPGNRPADRARPAHGARRQRQLDDLQAGRDAAGRSGRDQTTRGPIPRPTTPTRRRTSRR
jgi:hypothetical protein